MVIENFVIYYYLYRLNKYTHYNSFNDKNEEFQDEMK
jgi:hypothetical protein